MQDKSNNSRRLVTHLLVDTVLAAFAATASVTAFAQSVTINVVAAGVRAPQSVDAMVMVYMIVTLVWLLITMRFVSPTQLVSRVRAQPQNA